MAEERESLSAVRELTDDFVANCEREPKHPAGHGSYRLYKLGCHCDECRDAQNGIMRAYRERRRERERQEQIREVAKIIQRGIWDNADAYDIAVEVLVEVKP